MEGAIEISSGSAATVSSNSSEDIEFNLEYDIEEDIVAELEEFVQLCHLGQSEKAEQMFSECLKEHEDWFPVAAEYSDFLLRGGLYNSLLSCVQSYKTKFEDPQELQVFSLMEIIAKLETKAYRKVELETAFSHVSEIRQSVFLNTSEGKAEDIEIHLFGLILQIEVLNDSLDSSESYHFKSWFSYLLSRQMFWEAHLVLQDLMVILSKEERQTLCQEYFGAVRSQNPPTEPVEIALSSMVQGLLYFLTTGSRPNHFKWNENVSRVLLASPVLDDFHHVQLGINSITRKQICQILDVQISLPFFKHEKSVAEDSSAWEELYDNFRHGTIEILRREIARESRSKIWPDVSGVLLREAALGGNSEGVQLLLDNGVNIQAEDAFRRPPLHLAAIKGDEETVQLLLARGADSKKLDWFGRTALDWAIKCENEDAIDLLKLDSMSLSWIPNMSYKAPLDAPPLGPLIGASALSQASSPESQLPSSPPRHLPVLEMLRSSNALSEINEVSARSMYHPISMDEIRLVTIEPGTAEDPIVCSLNTVSLKNPGTRYTALSYAWGPYDDGTTILMDQDRVQIRSNLAAALYQLRDPKHVMTMWIDCLCMNMEDAKEVENHIAIWAIIYKHADEVYIWLGKDKEIQQAMSFVLKIRDTKEFNSILEESASNENLKGDWNSLVCLLRNRWFSRRWVIAEILLARQAYLWAGDHSIDWAEFSKTIESLSTRLRGIEVLIRNSGRIPSSWNILGGTSFIEAIRWIASTKPLSQDYKWPDETGDTILILQEMVCAWSFLESSHAHDTIYVPMSVLNGMSDTGFAKVNRVLPINYEGKVVDLYKDFVTLCIFESKSLDIICQCWATNEHQIFYNYASDGTPTRVVKSTLELPSWMLLASDSAFGKTGGDSDIRKNGDSFVGAQGRKIYDASEGTPPGFSIGMESGTPHSPKENKLPQLSVELHRSLPTTLPPQCCLLAKGFEVGTVIAISPTFAHAVILEEHLELGGYVRGAESKAIPDDFWRTLVADRGRDGKQPPDWWYDSIECCIREEADASGDIDVLSIIARGLHLEFLLRVSSVIWNRKLFRMNNGALGLAPRETRGGDLICILFGCSVPVVLREHEYGEGDYYRFVGEAFVYGAMEGEMMDRLREGFYREADFKML